MKSNHSSVWAKQIYKLWSQGLKDAQIAERINLSVARVNVIRREMGLAANGALPREPGSHLGDGQPYRNGVCEQTEARIARIFAGRRFQDMRLKQ